MVKASSVTMRDKAYTKKKSEQRESEKQSWRPDKLPVPVYGSHSLLLDFKKHTSL